MFQNVHQIGQYSFKEAVEARKMAKIVQNMPKTSLRQAQDKPKTCPERPIDSIWGSSPNFRVGIPFASDLTSPNTCIGTA